MEGRIRREIAELLGEQRLLRHRIERVEAVLELPPLFPAVVLTITSSPIPKGTP